MTTEGDPKIGRARSVSSSGGASWRRRALRWRDEAVVRGAPLTDTTAIANLTRAGIEYEKLVRALVAGPSDLVRETFAIVRRDEFDRLSERLSAAEERLRQLEAASQPQKRKKQK